ncbi:hypothetical protein SALBM217S_04848 [Streptomyces griseoloalbus]
MSGVITRSTVDPLVTAFIATGTRRVCSPETGSMVASHITGAGMTACVFFLSVKTTLPSDRCSTFRPLAFRGSV